MVVDCKSAAGSGRSIAEAWQCPWFADLGKSGNGSRAGALRCGHSFEQGSRSIVLAAAQGGCGPDLEHRTHSPPAPPLHRDR